MLFRRLFLAFFLLIILTGCQMIAENEASDEASGRVVLWHSWSESEAAVLQTMISEFEEIHPNVTVVEISFSENELLDFFRSSGPEGSGPDLLIGSSSWIQELADSGLIRPYTLSSNKTYSLAEKSVTYEDETYGLPLTLQPNALYYNQAMVDRLPATLEDLLAEAADGNGIAFVPRFKDAYWGIQAFGPDLFDDNGSIDLVNSGLPLWLDWLSEAQNEPGVILNVDETSLRQLFVQGVVAFYVSDPAEQNSLIEEMEDPFGVTILPTGPSGPAGPLLPAETLLFYKYSSQNQADLASLLAEFLTNQQQSIRLMREINKAPANRGVSVDSRLYPTVAGFIRQTRTAVVIPNEWSKSTLDAAGDRLYTAVLSGEVSPLEALCTFGRTLATSENLQTSEINLPAGCILRDVQGE